MKRVAIVGGGITGLVAAYDLERKTNAQITLYEAAERLGGKLQTAKIGDLLVEEGPDCFFARGGVAQDLICELGLEEQVIEPEASEFSMLVDGKLHRVPRGIVAFNSLSDQALAETSFLSEAGKQRAAQARDIPPDLEGEDESIRSYFTRRFGEEFSRLIAEPLLAGTHGGNPETLSMRALYPSYYTPPPSASLAKSGFRSFRGGMAALIKALQAKLTRTTVRLNAKVEHLKALDADALLLAIPANHAAPLVGGECGKLLNTIEHRSSTVVTLAYAETESLHGTGFLVPPSEPGPITGATWSSEKWPGRAPANVRLMRVFLGPTGDEETARHIERLLDIQGEPIFTNLQRWPEALPQYKLGHLDLVARIEDAAPKGLFLAGTSYRGVGIPDCIRQGREIAAKIGQN